MAKVENLLDIFKEVLLIRELHPEFRFSPPMPKEQQEYFASMAIGLEKMLGELPDKSLVLTKEDATITGRYLDAISNAVSNNDPGRLDAICAEIANSYETTDKVCESSDGCCHDGDCVGTVVNLVWWSWLVCSATLACVLKHLAGDPVRDRLFVGHCDDQGTGVCKCIQISFSLSAVLLLISILLVFFGGPVIGAAGRAAIQRLVLRMAPAA